MPGMRIAVFLDDSFWHRCEVPPSMEKIACNQARDIRVREHLESIGWTALRFWEQEAAEATVERVVSAADTSTLEGFTSMKGGRVPPISRSPYLLSPRPIPGSVAVYHVPRPTVRKTALWVSPSG
ncbi:hypothetical protein CQZ93_14750 [Ochrobactrum vermis]|nr:hypothetical protein CQZ93_14750 [Ochrobactrum vermis]